MSQTPVVIYAAKSTPDPKDSTGSQVEKVRVKIAQRGDRFEYAEPFAEDNKSGWSGNRGPKLDAAMAAAAAAYQEHGVAELWVFHSSRLGRGDGFGPTAARSLNEVVTACNRAGVNVRSVEDDEFVSNPMLVGIASTQANKYSADISSHVKRGKQRQLEQGQRLGGPVPDGMLLRVIRDEHDRVTAREYRFDPDREPTIRRMAALALEGHGAPAVGRILNAEGYRRKNGKPWDRRAVQHILKNPFYAGVVYQRGEMTAPGVYEPFAEPKILGPAEWPALIPLEDWRRIQVGMKTRDWAAKGRKPEGQRTTRYVLARLGTCDRCGARMYAMTSPYKRKDGSQARRYICGNAKAATGLCDQRPLDALKIDAAIVEHLSALFIDFNAWLEQLAQGQRGQRDRLEADLAQALAAQDKLAKQEDRLRARYIAETETGGVAETAAFEAFQYVITERETHQRVVRDLQEALAAEPVDPPTDSMLDVYNDLARAVRGTGEGTVAELNDRLRAVFAEFRMDQVEPGVIGILPILRADVVDRYADQLPIMRGPDGDKAGDLLPPASPTAIFAGDREDGSIARVQNTHWYLCLKPNRAAFAASQPYAEAGPRSSSVPSRCSDFPGGATHFGSGCAANRAACSALLRNALVMISATPSRRAAALIRSKASATSGRIRLPCRCASGPRYSPDRSPPAEGSVTVATSATARAARVTSRPATRIGSVTVTAIRVGASAVASGNATATFRAPLRRAVVRAARRASARYSARSRCRGLRTPRSNSAGANTRGWATRIASAPASAARSAAPRRSWCAPMPAATAASTAAPTTIDSSSPSSTTTACPCSSPSRAVGPRFSADGRRRRECTAPSPILARQRRGGRRAKAR